MDQLNFINRQGKYPLATETFQALQDNTALAASLARLIGMRYAIIQQPTASADGIAIFDYEPMPLKANPQPEEQADVVHLVTTSIDADIDGETITVQQTRYCHYAAQNAYSAADIPVSQFQTITINELMQSLAQLAQHTTPRLAIIDYYGSLNDLPYGYVPCTTFENEQRRIDEYLYGLYGNGNITIQNVEQGYSRVTRCLGMDIPDLTERFTLGANDRSFHTESGASGGEQQITLGISNTPRQSNEVNESGSRFTTLATEDGFDPDDVSPITIMPPYMAMHKLIKVI